MSNYAPGYPVNTNPGPAGDTVKQAVDKHISEFMKAYADLSAMYQQILVELEHGNVDMVDGHHADNTANNIPVLNSSGCLTSNVDNSLVTTTNLTVNGAAKVDSLVVGGSDVGSMVASRIKIDTGIVTNGQTIPLPAGFTQEQCTWFVVPRYFRSVTVQEIDSFECRADGNRVVTILIDGKVSGSSNATYVIIGIK